MSTLTSLPDGKASRIAQQLDDISRGAAESLHGAASSIRKSSKAIDELAETTAERLDDAGSYVEKHSVKRSIAQSHQLVQRYPGRSLVLAAGVGFLTGVAIRRLTHVCDKSAVTT
jgi:ElaB/YqjD/DUF883 family membrane-anchored ribosome-binding protein